MKSRISKAWENYQVLAANHLLDAEDETFEPMSFEEFEQTLAATSDDCRQDFLELLTAKETTVVVQGLKGIFTTFESWEDNGLAIGVVTDDIDMSPPKQGERL